MEKQYFILQNEQQTGPFTLEQLKGMQLSKETKIWYQGLDSWKMLYEVPEIMEFQQHISTPSSGNANWQSLNNTSSGGIPPECPKTYLTEAILVTLFCCVPLGVVSIVHAVSVQSKYDSKDYEGAERASAQAKQYMNYGFWGGFVVVVLYILLLVVAEGGRF